MCLDFIALLLATDKDTDSKLERRELRFFGVEKNRKMLGAEWGVLGAARDTTRQVGIRFYLIQSGEIGEGSLGPSKASAYVR